MFVYPDIPIPIALSLGPLHVHWYGLMYLVGFLAAWWLARRRAAQPGLDLDADRRRRPDLLLRRSA